MERPNPYQCPQNLNRSACLLIFVPGGSDLASSLLEGSVMKKIEATIQLSKLNEVQAALEDIGIDELTAYEVRGFDRRNRHKETYRSQEYTINFLPMIKIDLVVVEENVKQALNVIIQAAKTGSRSEHKVLISDVKEAACELAV
jgi:nitrogen regulatory protein PII